MLIKTAHYRQPTFLAVERAVEAGNLTNLPVMVDFGYFFPERPYQTMVLDKLRPGDISTHFYRWPAPLLDKNEKLLPYLAVARKRGVKFDVGHGGGSFHFRNAEPAIRQGFWPDSISTDMHSVSANGAMVDMLNVMSKILALGVPLKEVIRESTTNPAMEIRRPQLGHIAVGAEADIAVLRLEHGKFGFVDCVGGRIEGGQRLGCEMTLRSGKIVYDLNGRAGVPWRWLHNPISRSLKGGARMSVSRRDLFRQGGAVAAGLAAGAPAGAAPTSGPSPEVYTRIGVRPFINCTATLTINGGSRTRPEVIAAIEQASHYHVGS